MEVVSIVADDSEPGGDGWTAGLLAAQMGSVVARHCLEKQLVSGRARIPGNSVPSVNPRSEPIYNRYRSMGSLNMSDAIVKAVTERQVPNGFRMRGAHSDRSTDADEMYDRCNLTHVIGRVADDVAKFGSGYVLVADGHGDSVISYVPAWWCAMSDEEDNALVYTFDAARGKERLLLFRLLRDENGYADDLYYRIAERDGTSNTLPSPTDKILVEEYGDTYGTGSEKTWDAGSDWQWVTEPTRQGMEYAKACGHVPVFRAQPEGGESQISPHFATIMRIDHCIFNRMCIAAMQAFRQRAIKGLHRDVYKKTDPEVKSGAKREGELIDYSETFKSGVAALWQLPNNVDIWESATTDITPFVTAESNDIKRLASASRTPVDLLSPDVAGSAAGANLKHENLVSKVNKINAIIGGAFEQAMRMALVLRGGDPEHLYQLLWLPPEPRDWQMISQAISQLGGYLPRATVCRMIIGMSDQELAQMQRDEMDERFQSNLATQDDGRGGDTDGNADDGVAEETPDPMLVFPTVEGLDTAVDDGQ